jgi:DNA-binding NarL/FixJ family response regulator
MVATFYAERRTESQKIQCGAGANRCEPICFICSNHPLAVSLINNALSSDPELYSRSKTYFQNYKPIHRSQEEILIIDTCSIPKWEEYFQDWKNEGASIIGLYSPESQSTDIELQMFHMGASGILAFSDSLGDELLHAIRMIASGQVWIRRETLAAYVNWSQSAMRDYSISDPRLTGREKQILELLQRDLSNRIIAQRLAVSERTIKFHVSNILHKLNLTNRRELRTLQSSFGVFPLARTPRLSVISKTVEVADRRPA